MEYLSLGRIIKTKGLKGVVKIISCTEFGSQRYKKGNVVYLENPQTHEMVKMTVAYYNKEKGFDYIKENFQYTILENYNSKVDDEYVLKRESYWKEVFQSRKFGYNKN